MYEPLIALRAYYSRFAFAYIGITLLLIFVFGMIEWVFAILIDPSPVLTVAAMLTAGGVTISKFVADQERAPSAAERTRLIWVSIGTLHATSIAFLCLAMILEFGVDAYWVTYDLLVYEIGIVGMTVILIVMGIVTAILYAILYYNYGPFARKLVQKRQRAERPS